MGIAAPERIILIGCRGERSDFYPEIPVIQEKHKVGELFCDLPSVHAGEGMITGTNASLYWQVSVPLGIKEYDCEP
ncbi:MAG: hypothetical protein ACLRNW_11545 [Neglectibacter sp.]